MTNFLGGALLFLGFNSILSAAFVVDWPGNNNDIERASTFLSAAGKGFGKEGEGKRSKSKTYGEVVETPRKDVIDQEGAMESFFSSREEWHPVFRTVAGSYLPSDTAEFLRMPTMKDEKLDFHESSSPWKKMEPIPTNEGDREFLGKFLDSMHQSLLDIPVNELSKEDDNDMHFIEEGRRMLAISRFHVLREEHKRGSVESYDAIFNHCWSELFELSSSDQAHTGSLILLPDHDLSDLRRFTDMNLLRPLEWLGVHTDFEVVSLQRDSPAIRLLYKLNEVPSGEYTEEDGFAGVDKDQA